VIFEGVFYGPEPYKNVDPKLPTWIKERLEKSPRRYGHMDAFETMISVTKVIEATEVGSDAPYQAGGTALTQESVSGGAGGAGFND